MTAGSIIGAILRDGFIGGKCLLLVVKTLQGSCRFYATYDLIIQFEIWFLVMSAFKILILIPNILVVVNINYLFTMFVLNSLMLTIGNNHMHTKALSAMYKNENSIKLSLWMSFRLFALFLICMSAMYPTFGLRCSPTPYPPQLAALMYLDFFNATVDLIITF